MDGRSDDVAPLFPVVGTSGPADATATDADVEPRFRAVI